MENESDPELLRRLGTDAMKWAVEFNKTAHKLGYSEMDEGWLVGWFANAIENCDVIRANPLRSEIARLQKRVEELEGR
jgi:hypothetical protein